MPIGRLIPLVAVVLLALAVTGCAEPRRTIPQLSDLAGSESPTGEAAADFSVMTFDGATFTLSQHLVEDGRPVFLNLWASWCGPCRAEMPDIDEAASHNSHVAFIGVAVKDEVDKSREFADEIAVDYMLAFDEAREVDDGYAPIGLPASYIISSDGQVLERIFGPLTGAQIEEKLASHFG